MVDERRNSILMFLKRLILLFRTNLFSFSKGEFYAIMSAMEKKTTIKLNLNSLAVILYTSDLIPTKEGPLTNDEWYAIEKRIKDTGRDDVSSLIGMNREALMLLLDIDNMLIDKIVARSTLLADMIHSLHNLENEGIHVTTKYEDNYPRELYCLNNRMPLILYYVGNMDLIKDNNVSVVGPHVNNRTLNFATKSVINKVLEEERTLITCGIKGIDEYATRSILKMGGSVIMFVADHMLDKIRLNKRYLRDGHMLILCAVDPYAYFDVTNSLDRNIYVCGLSKEQFIIATNVNSGAVWFTSVQNLHYHWTTPLVVDASPYYNGNLRLIEMGAIRVSKDDLASPLDIEHIIMKNRIVNEEDDTEIDQMTIFEFIEE